MHNVKALLDNYSVTNPCKKQTVKAVLIGTFGNKAFGSNSINNYVSRCPREEVGFKTGEGYPLCKSICAQNEHAEVNAMDNAEKEGINLKNAKVIMTGHTYFCDNCINAMKSRGVSSAYCIDSNLELKF